MIELIQFYTEKYLETGSYDSTNWNITQYRAGDIEGMTLHIIGSHLTGLFVSCILLW